MAMEDCISFNEASRHSSSPTRSRIVGLRRYGSKSDDENDPDHAIKGRRRTLMRKGGSMRWYGSKSDDEIDFTGRQPRRIASLGSGTRPSTALLVRSTANEECQSKGMVGRPWPNNFAIDLSRSGGNSDCALSSGKGQVRQLYASSSKSSRESNIELKAPPRDEPDHSVRNSKVSRRNSLKAQVLETKLALASSEADKADLVCKLEMASEEAAARVERLEKEKQDLARASEEKIRYLEGENAKLLKRLKAMEKHFTEMQTARQREANSFANTLSEPATPRVSNKSGNRIPIMYDEGTVSEQSSNTSSTEDEGEYESDPLFNFSESLAAAEQDEASITKIFTSTTTVLTQSSSSRDRGRKGRKRSKTPRKRTAKSPRRQRSSSRKAA